MVRRFALQAALLAAMIQFLPHGHRAATAQEHEGCYMVDASGETIELGSLCDDDPEASAAADPAAAQGFIADYKRLAQPYPPETRDKLLAGIETSASEKIATAKKICKGVESGISIAEWRLRALNEALEMENGAAKDLFVADMEIIISIAPNHYCSGTARQ